MKINKKFIKNLLFLFISLIIIFYLFYNFKIFIIIKKKDIKNIKIHYNYSLELMNNYINDCENLIKYNRVKIKKKKPFLSICLPIYNMEKYIEKSLLSIINQSFQDFEIIAINDFSNDNTINIIKKLQSKEDRIKIINHSKNLGVYSSRVDGILNSKGKYVLLMDPDDFLLNQNLFIDLYNFNQLYNLDIIEFTIYFRKEGSKKIYYKIGRNHYHNYTKEIIHQPELSTILFYVSGTKKYHSLTCLFTWNKIIRKDIYIKTVNYIGKYYYNKYIINADDMFLNIINYHFAKNYSNINLPGYLYNIKNVSMSHGKPDIKIIKARSINHFFLFNIFYKYIKDFKKDRNFLLYSLIRFGNKMLKVKALNITNYIPLVKKLLKDIMNDKYISNLFRNYISQLLLIFES